MPTTRIATINKVVATGRSMKMRDGFMRLQSLRGGLLTPIAVLPLPFASPALVLRCRGLRMLGCVGGQEHGCAIPEPVATLGDDHITGLQALRHGDPLAIDDCQRDRPHRYCAVSRVHEIHERTGDTVRCPAVHGRSRHYGLVVQHIYDELDV